jgi:hypothetical protein
MTSTCFVTEDEDEPVARDKNGIRRTGQNTGGDEDGHVSRPG